VKVKSKKGNGRDAIYRVSHKVPTGPFLWCFASMAKFLREPHVGAKRAKHRAKRSPECGDPAKQGHAQILLIFNVKFLLAAHNKKPLKHKVLGALLLLARF
jgi:hypothetical protein